jgi:deazaflavin-dependent oxidoreductase (nitroreductase family)
MGNDVHSGCNHVEQGTGPIGAAVTSLAVTSGDTVRVMPDSPPPARIDMRVQNQEIVAAYRANAGVVEDGADPLVVITTRGTKTGNLHTTPICVRQDGDGAGQDLIVAGTAGGTKRHPQWYFNLVAEPEITVEYLGDTYTARAETVANSVDRDRLFNMMSTVIPGIYRYQDRCRELRQIPIVRLTRI